MRHVINRLARRFQRPTLSPDRLASLDQLMAELDAPLERRREAALAGVRQLALERGGEEQGDFSLSLAEWLGGGMEVILSGCSYERPMSFVFGADCWKQGDFKRAAEQQWEVE